MYPRVPLYKYKLCSTYGYFCTSISSITPTGDLNKYKSVISTSMCLTGDLNKYEYVISTSRCISLLYEFMKTLILLMNTCYCYMLIVQEYQCMCTYISHMFPTKRKA